MARAAPILAFAIVLPAALPGAAPEASASQVLDIACYIEPFLAMEYDYSRPGCWAHWGTHTYFVGRNQTWLLRGISGLAFSVEQQLSYPYEGLRAGTDNLPNNSHITSSVVVETSLDGLQWETVHYAPYDFGLLHLLNTEDPTLLLTLEEGPGRQNVFIEFELQDPKEFRFLRFRQPMSASLGLAGYLDFTRATLRVDAGHPAPPPPLMQGALERNCGQHIMERMLVGGDPCTFGHLNRYDTPSFFHTYFLGLARPDKVEVAYAVLPWRTDDFYWPHNLSVSNLRGTLQDLPAILQNDTRAVILLQGSADGAHWTALARHEGRFLVPGTFSVGDLGQPDLAFLRLMVDKHQGWDVHPALHHPRGYMVHSTMRVEGLVPM